jgi:hypothetical protein
VLPATRKGHSKSPIFFLDGGPGQAATKALSFFADSMKYYRLEHDIFYYSSIIFGELTAFHFNLSKPWLKRRLYSRRALPMCNLHRIGGISALALAVLKPYEGSIVPLVILSIIWLFMTTAAWILFGFVF